MWNGLVQHRHVVDKNLGGVSHEQGVPAPHQNPQPRVPVTGRQVLITSGCKKQQGLSQTSREKLLESQAVPLKELTQTHLLRLIPCELQYQGSSLKVTSGIQRETKVSDIKVRAGGQLFLPTKGQQKHCPFLNPSPTEPQSDRWVPYLRLYQPG